MSDYYQTSPIILEYKKNFLNDIYSNGEEITEKGRDRIEKDTEFVFLKISKILNEDEFLSISFEKMLQVLNITRYQKQFKTDLGFKKELMYNGGFSINIDLGNYCNHNCSHCMVSANVNEEQTNINDFLKKMDHIPERYFSKLIKEISFYNFGEFLDYKDFDKIFEYFLKRGVNKFHLVTRGPKKEQMGNVEKKINKLKNKYPYFNLNLGLSFDNFSSIGYEENLINLMGLYGINKNILKNNEIELKITINSDNYEKDYNKFIYKLEIFLNELGIDVQEIHIMQDGIIDKIIFKDGFEVNISINIIKPLGRGKGITNSRFDNSLLDFTNCFPVVNPFMVNLTGQGDLKTCFSKDFSASTRYRYGNISDEQFLDKIIKTKIDFFRNIKLEDLVGKSKKHACMAVNLLLTGI